VVTPGDTGCNTPVEAVIVATEGKLLFHEPGVTASVSVNARLGSAHALLPAGIPVGIGGNAFTVTTKLAVHAPGLIVLTITITPGDIPPTTPVAGSIVPMPGLLDVQTPPGGLEESVMVLPTHTCDGPVIAPGSGSTVTVTCDWHPVPGAT